MKGLGLVSEEILINDLEDLEGGWLIKSTDGTQSRGGVSSGKGEEIRCSLAVAEEHEVKVNVAVISVKITWSRVDPASGLRHSSVRSLVCSKGPCLGTT